MRRGIATVLLIGAAACSFGTVLPPADEGDEPPGAVDATAGADAADSDAAVVTGVSDGAVDGSSDASSDAGPKPTRFMFVTSTQKTGSFGGFVGGDQECEARALAGANVLVGRKFRAWLSAGTTSASERLTVTGSIIRLDGKTIATDLAKLANSELQNPVIVNELGIALNSTSVAWTGTSAIGTPSGDDCNGWVSTNGTGSVGSVSSTAAQWTNAGVVGCNEDHRLYCIEVDP